MNLFNMLQGRRFLWGALLALFALWWGPPQAQAAPMACLIEPSRVVDVGSPVLGVIEAMPVDRGSQVRKGDVLVQLRGDVERASMQVAATRSQAQAELAAAQAAADYAQRKFERSQELERKEFISPQAVEQARSEAHVAAQRLAAAREQQRLSNDELDLARSQLAQRSIKAPFSGVVIERFMNPGERAEDRPLLRLAKLDVLRVEMVLPTQHLGQFKPGDEVEVVPEIKTMPTVRAKVTQVDAVLDAASRSFRMRLDLPNTKGQIQAGVRCTASLGDGPNPAASVVPAKAGSGLPLAATPVRNARP